MSKKHMLYFWGKKLLQKQQQQQHSRQLMSTLQANPLASSQSYVFDSLDPAGSQTCVIFIYLKSQKSDFQTGWPRFLAALNWSHFKFGPHPTICQIGFLKLSQPFLGISASHSCFQKSGKNFHSPFCSRMSRMSNCHSFPQNCLECRIVILFPKICKLNFSFPFPFSKFRNQLS